jgi:hypothetical protein
MRLLGLDGLRYSLRYSRSCSYRLILHHRGCCYCCGPLCFLFLHSSQQLAQILKRKSDEVSDRLLVELYNCLCDTTGRRPIGLRQLTTLRLYGGNTR